MKQVAIWIVAGFAGLVIIGKLLPEKSNGPEMVGTNIVGCPSQDVAVALARALSLRGGSAHSDAANLAERSGCSLVTAGTYVTVVKEEAGNEHVTKVFLSGNTIYLLGLQRPIGSEKLSRSVADLKKAWNSLIN